MKVVIMAGGKGTRIAQLNSDMPKPMLPICGKPILEHQIECLRLQDLTDIIIVIGHLGDVIQNYFKDGKSFGVSIEYFIEVEPLGTAGALFYLRDKLIDDFLLINGDIIFDIDINRFYDYHKSKGGKATIFTHPNNHPYDSVIIKADFKCKAQKWLLKEEDRLYYKNRVNAGIHIISPDVLMKDIKKRKVDLDRDILKSLVEAGCLYVYDSPEYVKDMGTPERYYEVEEDFKSGKITRKNLRNKQKAIFLDRDGTINKYVGFLTNIGMLELLPNVEKAIKKINESGYLAIIVTNQPVIARGEVTLDELEEIHNKMETLLGNAGAYLDDIFYCPHHPDKGYEGERIELKVECECRKPKSGLLFQAANKYNIDLSQSWMIGDSRNDILAGKGAGCKVAIVSDKEEEGIATYKDVLSFVDAIL